MKIDRHRKLIARFFLILMAAELLLPLRSVALTSGPSQPEMTGFQPISGSDLVDLFTGDFNYNIPLMDVGGYPLNLAYQAGSGMDDEASWVGYGWGLNPGVLNRQLRGLPDDFNGQDMMTREMSMKDHITKGAKVSVSLDFLGIPKDKIKAKAKKKKQLNLTLSLSLGVKFDNYRGVGMELGANTGLSLSNYVAGDKTAKPTDTLSLSGTKTWDRWV